MLTDLLLGGGFTSFWPCLRCVTFAVFIFRVPVASTNAMCSACHRAFVFVVVRWPFLRGASPSPEACARWAKWPGWAAWKTGLEREGAGGNRGESWVRSALTGDLETFGSCRWRPQMSCNWRLPFIPNCQADAYLKPI